MEGPGEDSGTDRVRAAAGTDAGPRGPGSALPGHHRWTPPNGNYLHWEQGLPGQRSVHSSCCSPGPSSGMQSVPPSVSALKIPKRQNQTKAETLVPVSWFLFTGVGASWSYSRRALARPQARVLTRGVCHPPRVVI